MKPLKHSIGSVKRYGGSVDDYLPIHTLIDSPKGSFADVRHRALLHNSFGPFLAEQVFGYYITNSDGKMVSVRQIVEDHIVEDMGRIPEVGEWLREMPIKDWMDRTSSYKKCSVRKWKDIRDED